MVRIRQAAMALVVSLSMLQGGGLAGDWPHFMGPNSNNTAPDKGINKDWQWNPPKELWRVTMSDGGFAGPCIVGGKLFISDHNHKENYEIVRAIDVKTGKDIWRYKYPSAYKSWEWGFTASVPACDGKRVYTLDREGQLHCIDAEKGTRVWTRNLSKQVWKTPVIAGRSDFYTSPVIDGNNLIIMAGVPEAGVVAYDKETGADVWKAPGSCLARYTTPTVAVLKGKRRYLFQCQDGLQCLDPDNGQLLWKLPIAGHNPVRVTAPVAVGDNIFISDSGAGGSYMVSSEGTLLWKADDKAPPGGALCAFNSPVYVDGYLYGGGHTYRGGGYYYEIPCLDAKTGNPTWKHVMFEGGGMVGVDGLLIALHGDTGDVVLLKSNPKEYEELARVRPFTRRVISSTAQCWTQPAVADGRLFIRNEKELVCIDLK